MKIINKKMKTHVKVTPSSWSVNANKQCVVFYLHKCSNCWLIGLCMILNNAFVIISINPIRTILKMASYLFMFKTILSLQLIPSKSWIWVKQILWSIFISHFSVICLRDTLFTAITILLYKSYFQTQENFQSVMWKIAQIL